MLVILGLMVAPLYAQNSGYAATTIDVINVRIGPGSKDAIITTLPARSQVFIEGRNKVGNWVMVHTPDNSVRGWVATRYLQVGDDFNLGNQPILNELIQVNSPAPANGNQAPTASEIDQMIARLKSVPVLPSSLSNEVWQVFNAGRRLGNRPDVFSKVGDCHTANYSFLLPIAHGQYDLGPFGYLQDTINYFSVSPRAGVLTSLDDESMAAHTAFTFGAVMDPMWSNPAYCKSGERPLECEYRLVKPSVAIIMMGSVDMEFYTPDKFKEYANWVIQSSKDLGVIPVMNTFDSNPNYYWEKSLQFNNILLDIAEEKSVPIINFWLAAQPLPNEGLQPDNFHLTAREDQFQSFNGDQNQFGLTMRNLLTLQMLDTLRKKVLAP
jgi:hypothetical protein